MWLHFIRKARPERDQIFVIVPLFFPCSEAPEDRAIPVRRGLHVMMFAATGSSEIPRNHVADIPKSTRLTLNRQFRLHVPTETSRSGGEPVECIFGQPRHRPSVHLALLVQLLKSGFGALETAHAVYWFRNVRNGGPKLHLRPGTGITRILVVERLSKIDLH